MEYKRLTKKIQGNELLQCGKTTKEQGQECCNNCSWCEHQQRAFSRLSELEDKIENGTLIEKRFIKEGEFLYTKAPRFCICEYDDTCCLIVAQCETREEAEAKLKELGNDKNNN